MPLNATHIGDIQQLGALKYTTVFMVIIVVSSMANPDEPDFDTFVNNVLNATVQVQLTLTT